MTIQKQIELIAKLLEKAKIPSPQLEAELIISHILKISREKLLSQYSDKIKSKDLKKIKKITKKRLTHYPWAYIAESKEFYQSNFIVNKHTLIPRPESEIIIEEVLEDLELKKDISRSVIDLGSGSGCLIISLAKIIGSQKNIKFWGLDINKKTLKVAKKNAKKHKIKNIKFKKSNLLKRFSSKGRIKRLGEQLIIMANLPYLTKKEIKQVKSLKFEPRQALLAGPDGLKYYRKLIKQIKKISENKTNSLHEIIVYQEINPWQVKKLEKIIKKTLRNQRFNLEIINDLSGQERLVKLTLEV